MNRWLLALIMMATTLAGVVVGLLSAGLLVGRAAGPQGVAVLVAVGVVRERAPYAQSLEFVDDGGAELTEIEQPGTVETEPTPEQHAQDVLADLDQLAHPHDPDKPANVAGWSDQQVQAIPPDQVDILLAEYPEHARVHEDAPRHLFTLARVAQLHGRATEAAQLLTEAAQKGSSPALAYLADAQLAKPTVTTADLTSAAGLLQQAVAGGFQPAGDALAQVQAELSKRTLDPDRFQRPEFIRAFATSDLSSIQADPVQSYMALRYVAAFSESFATVDPRFLNAGLNRLNQVAPGLATKARFAMTRPENQITGAVMEMGNTVNSWVSSLERGSELYEQTKSTSGDEVDWLALTIGLVGGAMEVEHKGAQLEVDYAALDDQARTDAITLTQYFLDGAEEDATRVYKGMYDYVQSR